MGEVTEKLAVQIGPRGFFAEVTLYAESTDGDHRIVIDFDGEHANQWQSGARFGIDYVLDHVDKKMFFPNGGTISVRYIRGNPVDTSNVVIAFVTANALLKALGVEIKKKPDFNQNTGVFSFPK